MHASLLPLVLLLALPLCAQSTANVTEPGRTLSRPLSLFFASSAGEAPERTFLLLVDPTASVQAAGLPDLLAEALAEQKKDLARTRIGLGVVGSKGTVVLPPTDDHALLLKELKKSLEKPSNEFQNLYDDIRTAAGSLANAPGERRLLLVSFDNGDAEDDVEATVTALHKAKVKLSVVTSEAYVADSYWAARQYQEKPRGTTLQGGDAPVIDLPWGWLFQITVANEVTPAACGPYALNRLAAASEGKVHLFNPPVTGGHQCAFYAQCLFCQGDHLPPEEVYWDARSLKLLPPCDSRRDAYTALGRDPYYRAVIQTWRKAADEGLVRSEPPVRVQGTVVAPDRQRFGRDIDLMSGLSFARHAQRADKAAEEANKIGAMLDAEIARIGRDQGAPRQEAIAHFTRLMVQLARVNLITFAGWCRDVAPVQVAAHPEVLLPPELPVVEAGRDPVGIAYSNLCLCHGVRPFLEVELPGGELMKKELERLDKMVTVFLERYGHTQYAFALHRSGIAKFTFSYPGIVGNIPRPRPRSDSDDKPTTTPDRPGRPPRGGATTGGPSGPTSGGK